MTDRHREQMSNTLIGDDCIMGTGWCSIWETRRILGTAINLDKREIHDLINRKH